MYSVGIVPVLVSPPKNEFEDGELVGSLVCDTLRFTRPQHRRHPLEKTTKVAAAAVFGEFGALAWAPVAKLVGGAICVIAWLNLRCALGHLHVLYQEKWGRGVRRGCGGRQMG